MSNAKRDMLKKINNRAKQIRQMRNISNKAKTARDIILTFLEDVEDIDRTALHADMFYRLIHELSNALDSKMKMIDPGVKLGLKWNNATIWTELRVEAVHVRWSLMYQHRAQVPPEETIDIMALFFQ